LARLEQRAAVMSGDDEALADSIAMSADDRAAGVEFLASLPAELRAQMPTPEHLVGLFFARETLAKVDSVQILEPLPGADAQHVTLPIRAMEFDERVGIRKLPMESGRDGWRMTAPRGMIAGVRRILQSTPQALDPSARQPRRSN
jgi:hypothetical protein